jgi:hypothetical protein
MVCIPDKRPCQGSDGQSPASHHEGSGSVTIWSTKDLQYAKWHRDSYVSEHFVFYYPTHHTHLSIEARTICLTEAKHQVTQSHLTASTNTPTNNMNSFKKYPVSHLFAKIQQKNNSRMPGHEFKLTGCISLGQL